MEKRKRVVKVKKTMRRPKRKKINKNIDVLDNDILKQENNFDDLLIDNINVDHQVIEEDLETNNNIEDILKEDIDVTVDKSENENKPKEEVKDEKKQPPKVKSEKKNREKVYTWRNRRFCYYLYCFFNRKLQYSFRCRKFF